MKKRRKLEDQPVDPNADIKEGEDYKNFEATLKQIIKVPKKEIDKMLSDEKHKHA